MSAAAVDLSVIVATRNRSRQLRALLESLRGCAVPAGVGVELLVVDNGSDDDTRAVVERMAGSFAYPARYLLEPRTGVCRARNAGIAQARGAIVALTDDDCVVDRDWLAGIWRVYQDFPGVTGVFGRVLPLDDVPVDATTLSVKPSTEPEDRRFPCSPFIGHGNNVSFRREALLSIGGFDPAFGPGAPLRAAEEVEMVYRLLRRGAWMRYDPRIVLHHAPRPTHQELLSAHRRNAIGLAAFFMKHALRGDLYAAKLAWWWWRATWAGYRQAARQQQPLVKEVKAAYLRSFVAGIGVSLSHAFSGRSVRP